MQVATTERRFSAERLQEYTEFFKEFDYEVTKSSLPAAYQAPVARWLQQGTLSERVQDGRIQCIVVGAPLLADTPVCDFSGNPKFWMRRGDMFIERIAFQDIRHAKEEIGRILEEYENVFFELWEEMPRCQQIVKHFGLEWLCTKILHTDELVGVYGRFARPISVPYGQCDLVSVAKLNIQPFDVADCRNSLSRVPAYSDHYSMCSKGNTWSAVSLRGYGGLAEFISKPSEMSQRWKNENPEKLKWNISDTPLRAALPEFEPLIEAIPGEKHRIRLMRLKPGGGEIYRHTDIQDADAGTEQGKLMRVHIPIITSPSVKFECWNLRGVSKVCYMAPGESWYVDVRKPHRVENYGTTDRIHLVIDAESNEPLKRLVCD
jgi:Aspartyl/Asparaginyl beta-hydroxylase